MLTKVLFVFSILAAILGYHMYNEFVPPHCSNPTGLKAFLTIDRFEDYIIQWLDKLGIVDYTRTKRYVLDTTARWMQHSSQDIETEDSTIAGVVVRIYRPRSKSLSTLRPGMVYYHGGGWTLGSIDLYHSATMMFSEEVNMVVISVEYRLSPENSQRDGLDDCVAVTKSLLLNAVEYGVDPNRVVVAGDSAGGNYAATVSLVLRDQAFRPMPKLQVLIYPVTQAIDLMLPSYQQYVGGPFLNRQFMCFFFAQATAKNLDYISYYDTNTHVSSDVRVAMANDLLNHDLIQKEQKYQPYVAPNYESGQSEVWSELEDLLLDPYLYPLMADDLSDLPDAYVFTAQHDPLRDEGYLYVKRLKEAGVTVTHYNSPVGWHGMLFMAYDFADSKEIMLKMATFLQNNL